MALGGAQRSGSQTLAAATPTRVLGHNPRRAYAALVNDSANVIYVGLSNTPSVNSGIRLNANGGTWEFGKGLHDLDWIGEVWAIAGAGPSNLTVIEISYEDGPPI